MSDWFGLDSRFDQKVLGLLPNILLASDPRSVKEQLEDRYAHGGGWQPMQGFTRNEKTGVMYYPGDPPFEPTAFTHIHGETVVFYHQGTLLCVIQPDGSWEVSRVD